MKRDYSQDTLRSFAAILVVLLHTSAMYVTQSIKVSNFDFIFLISNIIDSFCRVSVPLFVLISGHFLLGRQESFSSFYKKRISKILIPLIVWSLIYSLLVIAGRLVQGSDLRLNEIGESLLLGHVNHLWYLYMLIGLYAVTPVVNLIIERVSRKSLWGIASFFVLFAFAHNIFNIHYNNILWFPLEFTNFMGYYLLGYLIKDAKKTISMPLLLTIYVLSSILTAVCSHYTATEYGTLYFYEYVSPFVFIGSICLYTIFSQTSINKNWLSSIGKYSFGIYLIHPAILTMFNILPPLKHIIVKLDQYYLGIPVIFIVAYLTSLLISLVLSKIKYLRKII